MNWRLVEAIFRIWLLVPRDQEFAFHKLREYGYDPLYIVRCGSISKACSWFILLSSLAINLSFKGTFFNHGLKRCSRSQINYYRDLILLHSSDLPCITSTWGIRPMFCKACMPLSYEETVGLFSLPLCSYAKIVSVSSVRNIRSIDLYKDCTAKQNLIIFIATFCLPPQAFCQGLLRYTSKENHVTPKGYLRKSEMSVLNPASWKKRRSVNHHKKTTYQTLFALAQNGSPASVPVTGFIFHTFDIFLKLSQFAIKGFLFRVLFFFSFFSVLLSSRIYWPWLIRRLSFWRIIHSGFTGALTLIL